MKYDVIAENSDSTVVATMSRHTNGRRVIRARRN